MSIRSSTEPIHNNGHWMFEAIELAREGMALAHPNPRVGAVVVKDGFLVGQGFHIFDRRDHAEIVALKKAGGKARGATLYVSLEPCSTTGRTGPCTHAIIASGIKTVYAPMKDPNPAVAGRGFAALKRAGIEVHIVESYKRYAQETNEAFAKWIRTGLPFVTQKIALTLDGQISSRKGSATWITGEASREAVQRIRHEADALLTGIGSILADDSRLTDRTGEPRRRPLLRVILDSRLRLPLRSQIVKNAAGDLAIFTIEPPDSAKGRALAHAGAEVVHVAGRRGRVDLHSVLRELGRREMLSVLIEAGAELNGAALEAGIVDKMILFYAPRVMGTGGVPMVRIPSRRLAKAPALTELTLNTYGPDFIVEGYFHDVYGNHRARRKN
jgi:diaminohydroxyphosphoribosylaminopyrimidine deaminase / 5-amino-6-(5-phosphoribosylamino)uracil reductase